LFEGGIPQGLGKALEIRYQGLGEVLKGGILRTGEQCLKEGYLGRGTVLEGGILIMFEFSKQRTGC
jgi:hypothetical protein